ncbi:MAG: hypothetical protein Q8O67_09240 [Deltaproteobacteria bacterium]|nr:hypothetical protein [Deltaproteobacteria bacterium]
MSSGPLRALGLATFIVLVGGLLLKGATPAGRSDPSATVDNGAPRGLLALRLLLEAHGRSVEVVDEVGADTLKTRGAGDLIFIAPPERSAYVGPEVDELWQAATRGARVVIVCDEHKGRNKRLAALLAPLGGECGKVDEATAPTTATATMEPVPGPVFVRDRARLRLTDKAGLVPLLVVDTDPVTTESDNVLAFVKSMGAGDVVVVASAGSLSNDGLGLEQSAAFALWVVGDRRVVIDERHHKSRGRAVVARAALRGPGPLTAALCLFLLVPLSLLSLAPRKGDADDDDDGTDAPAAQARVRALAVLLHEEGSPRASKQGKS